MFHPFQLLRYRTYVEVLSARILANGEDAELVDSMMAQQQQQQQPQLSPQNFMTDLDADNGSGGVASPNGGDKEVVAQQESSVVGSAPHRTQSNRYSYRAAIYHHPENPQDIG